MRKVVLLFGLLFTSANLFAQSTSDIDKVLGIWLNEDKDAKMEIFKSGNKYFGRLLWGSEIYEKDGKTTLKDTENPDPKLRTRTRLNMVFM